MQGKRYSQQFRDDAVRHWMESGKRADDVSRELGISTWSLRRWKAQYLEELDGGAGAAELGQMKPSEMEAEIRRLRKDLRETEEQREILRKAVIFFGQESGKRSRL